MKEIGGNKRLRAIDSNMVFAGGEVTLMACIDRDRDYMLFSEKYLLFTSFCTLQLL